MNRPAQQQPPPGTEARMTPKPGRGETNDKGRNTSVGRAAAITGDTPIL